MSRERGADRNTIQLNCRCRECNNYLLLNNFSQLRYRYSTSHATASTAPTSLQEGQMSEARESPRQRQPPTLSTHLPLAASAMRCSCSRPTASSSVFTAFSWAVSAAAATLGELHTHARTRRKERKQEREREIERWALA